MNDLQPLCDKLNNAGIRNSFGELWNPNYATLSMFKYIPEPTFKSLLKMRISNCDNFAQYMDLVLSGDWRYFQPEIINRGTNEPCLMLGINEYLSFSRQGYFNCHHLPGGEADFCRGSFRLDNIFNKFDSTAEESKLLAMVAYSAFYDAGCKSSKFRKWCESHKNSISDFVKKSMMIYYAFTPYYDWEDMKMYVSTDFDWNNSSRRIFRVIKNGTPVCEFAFGRKTIQVKQRSIGCYSPIVTLSIPEYGDGFSDTYSKDKFFDSFNYSLRADDKKKLYQILLVMALETAGYRLDWCGITEFSDDSSEREFECTNKKYIIEIRSLHDITSTFPDDE